MKNSHVDILCYYDQHHDFLYENIFYKSYENCLCKDTFSIKSQKINSLNHREASFLSNDWSRILIDRYDYLIDYAINNKNSWAIFSDVDVVFLANIKKSIKNIINQNNKNNINISYMKELSFVDKDKNINGGFFLFKCCDQIVNYFKIIQILTKKMKFPNDQECINKNLLGSINYNFLPNKDYITNNNDIILSKKYLKNKKIKVFHATSAPNLLCKLQVLTSVLYHISHREYDSLSTLIDTYLLNNADFFDTGNINNRNLW